MFTLPSKKKATVEYLHDLYSISSTDFAVYVTITDLRRIQSYTVT